MPSQSLIAESIEHIKWMKYRKVLGGYRRREERGISTSVTWCDGVNSILDDVISYLHSIERKA